MAEQEPGVSRGELLNRRQFFGNMAAKGGGAALGLMTAIYLDKLIDLTSVSLPPYYLEPFEGFEPPSNPTIIYDERDLPKRSFGSFFAPGTAEAATWTFANFVPDADEYWWAMDPFSAGPAAEAQRRLVDPNLYGIGNPAHKLDIFLRGRYGGAMDDGIKAKFLFPPGHPLAGQQWAIDARSYAELLTHEVVAFTPRSWAGYCANKAKWAVRHPAHFSRDPRQFNLGAMGQVTVYDYDRSGMVAMAGTTYSDLEVDKVVGLKWMARTGNPVYANIPIGDAAFFFPIYGVTNDFESNPNALVRTTNFGQPHRNQSISRITHLYVPTKGEITRERMISKGHWLNPWVFAPFVDHVVLSEPLPPVEDFLNYRQRLFDTLSFILR